MSHQRGGMKANERILNFLKEEYGEPEDFQHFVYMSQLLQGDAIKTAMEAHRRGMPYCMGSLVWQHNDCWPVASWSGRDYYGRWKAQHYFTVKSFRDILMSPVMQGDELVVYAISDRLIATSGKMNIQIIDMKKGIVDTQILSVRIPANSSTPIWSMDLGTLLKGLVAEDVVIHINYQDKSGEEYTNNFFAARQKDMRYVKPEITTITTPVADGYELTLISDHFARGVFISLNGKDEFISDNYMDLLPDTPYTVKVTTILSAEEFDRCLRIISFN